MTVRELLSDETKWCKGPPREGKDERGLNLAIGECYPAIMDSFLACMKVRCTGLIPDGVTMKAWNDAPERTFAEMRRVIEEAGI